MLRARHIALRTRLPSATRVSIRSIMSFSSPNEVVIVSAARTPVGSFQGALKSLTAPQLGAVAVKAALERAQVKPELVDEVYFGNVISAGVGQSPARQVVLGAGLPERTDATTINKVCASGLKAITIAAQNVQLGHANIVVAGGMESMSNTPYYHPRVNPPFGHVQAKDSLLVDGLWDAYNDVHMGNCAENTAKKHGISREDQDAHAIESYKRAAKAWESGAFQAEIAPVTVTDRKGTTVIKEDEEYKNVKFDKIPTLKPVFQKENGTVTAANASNLNDGASAVVLTSAAKAAELGLKPLAPFADAAIAPIDFPIAPTVALPIALERAGLKAEDIAQFELNEAFSVVVRAAEKIMNIDPLIMRCYNRGAVALGHAIGNSGCRIVVTLAHSLKPGEYGAAGICNGVRGGAASAIVIQKL
ncbi:3-ketoacyl-CoA-thiolase, peroxisomal [Rhizoctonia solani AG-1 IA]|uniref:acetyl-CoA C-acetyltransferase n=1 Tax=Thanatephorus cucumeris (strain AG1-IA) TaxID=983506 RepID=L8WYI2_THACA|nr:3-ketoacyl-CoA-thiolase, peroxisomal [Rhizoctonia solani AG-1 IA]